MLNLNDHMSYPVVDIVHGSPEYDRECLLRDELLRAPLGLSLYDEDLVVELEYYHFGIFCSTSGECMACLVGVPIGGGLFQLKQMAVDKDWQRRGLGARLLGEAENRLASHGARRYYLHARDTAIGFYRKQGYELVGESFEEVTIPHFKMEKQAHG